MGNILHHTETALNNISRNKTAFISVSLILALVFSILGSLFLTVLNINANITALAPSSHIKVYLNESADERDAKDIQSDIKAISGVDSTKIVSKEEALEELKSQYGKEYGELFELIGDDENPLAHSIRVSVDDNEKIESIANSIEEFANVKKVLTVSESAAELIGLKKIISNIYTLFFILALILGVLLTFKSVYSVFIKKQREIELMRYIGAKKSFIRTPFILYGVFLGFASSIIAFLGQMGFYAVSSSIMQKYDYISVISFAKSGIILLLITVIITVACSVIGAFFATRKRISV